MAKLIFNLPGGLKAEREVSDTTGAKPSVPHVPAFAPDPESAVQPEKNLLEKAVEAVEEAVKPKTRRGRPKKKADAD
jgi:hypothetical protein